MSGVAGLVGAPPPQGSAPLPGADLSAQASQAAAAALLIEQEAALKLALRSVRTSSVLAAPVGQPELPKLKLDLLCGQGMSGEGMSADELQILAAAMISDSLDKQTAVSMENLLARKDQLAKTNADRAAKLLEAQQKARDAEPGFFGKVLAWAGKAISAVVSVVALVVGALVAATGVGVGVGLGLMALGGYMMAGLVVDAIDAVREKQGLDPLGWSPTLGQLAKVIAGAVGASEEVQDWIKMGVDMVTDMAVGIVATLLLPGAGALMMTEKFAKVARFVEVGVTTTKKLRAGASFVQGGMGLAQGGIGIFTGSKSYSATKARAESQEIVARMTKLQASVSNEIAIIEKTEETRKAALTRCSDSVAQSGAAAAAITANMAGMV